MIAIAPLALALLFAIASLLVRRIKDPRKARRHATFWVVGGFLLGAVAAAVDTFTTVHDIELFGTGMHLLPDGLLKLFPVVTCLVSWVAIAMSPAGSHPARTQARILSLLAQSLGFLVTPEPILIAGLWATSALTTWLELRQVANGLRVDRLFAIYHLPSVILFSLGAFLITRDISYYGVISLLIGIAIRQASLPVHSWFPAFVDRAPLGLVVLFVSPQVEVIAQLEFLSGGLPADLVGIVATLGVVTAIGAAVLGVAQQNARRAAAYLIMSQMGLVAFGLENHTSLALTGALLTWQVLSLATAGYTMALAALESRHGSLDLRVPHGNFENTPRLAIAFLILGFSMIGFPTTLGFVAEDLLVQGSVNEFPSLGLCLIIATAFNGLTVMRSFFSLFCGARRHMGESDLTRRETLALSLVIATLILGGMIPGPVVAIDAEEAHTETALPLPHR
ncbi:MAG: proton-conducting transporter membrane subunit [Deltaproteobacteria bacterium]|nr:proton-conducting transporter membrane subunit [Deltaproteobacteria bacterium]